MSVIIELWKMLGPFHIALQLSTQYKISENKLLTRGWILEASNWMFRRCHRASTSSAVALIFLVTKSCAGHQFFFRLVNILAY